jgi:hypothetical protein
MEHNTLNHEVHKGHEVNTKDLIVFKKINVSNFVYLVNFVVQKRFCFGRMFV